MASHQNGHNPEQENDEHPRNAVEVEGALISLNTETLQQITSDKTKNKLGSGSFANVYKYKCPDSNKVIALKKLKKELRGKGCRPIAKALLSEISVHRDLEHKNILKFFGNITDSKEGIFLIIQYAEKKSLNDLMEAQELNRNHILIYIEQILEGLNYLHSYTDQQGYRQPIAHRDLRSHNVLMMGDGTLKIADFGLCKRLLDMAEASAHKGISSKRGNSYWVGPELVDRRRRRDLPAEILVLTDMWSLGVLILELYYYGAWRVPYIYTYKFYEEYIFKLGRGWGPKTPEMAPEEVKKLLSKCFQYVIDERTSAKDLLKDVKNFDSGRKGNLEIIEPIQNVNESASDSDNTLTSRDTATTIGDTPYRTNGGETDPLEESRWIDDTKYLTKLHDPDTLIPHSVEKQQKIIRSITQNTLNQYVAEGAEEFILEDHYKRDGTYHVKRKGSDQTQGFTYEKQVFSVCFRGDGKILYLKRRPDDAQTIFKIDSSHKRNRCFSASHAGGIFAHVNEPGKLKRALNMTSSKMEVNSATEEGARTLDLMSPLSRRRLETVPGAQASSEESTDTFYTAQESLNGSSTEFTVDNRNLDVKKVGPEGYTYTIRYREDEVEIGYFNTLMKEGKCEILVTSHSNTALVTTIVAYYYQQKCYRVNKFEWLENLKNRSGTSISNRLSSSASSYSGYTNLADKTP